MNRPLITLPPVHYVVSVLVMLLQTRCYFELSIVAGNKHGTLCWLCYVRHVSRVVLRAFTAVHTAAVIEKYHYRMYNSRPEHVPSYIRYVCIVCCSFSFGLFPVPTGARYPEACAGHREPTKDRTGESLKGHGGGRATAALFISHGRMGAGCIQVRY